MNEWFKKKTETVKQKWTSWTPLQKGIVVGIVVVVVAVIILMASLSSRDATVRLFNTPISNASERFKIEQRLAKDNVKVYFSSDNYVSVDNEELAKHYRSQLVAEGYAPANANAYDLFNLNRKSWNRNDFDDAAVYKQAMESLVKNHLETIDGIQSADVLLTLPEDTLLNQATPTASVTLYSDGTSDVLTNKKKIKGIQNLIAKSVQNLQPKDVIILDNEGKELTDFEGMAESDEIANQEKRNRQIMKLEADYSKRVLDALQGTYGRDRVNFSVMKIEMDMSPKKTESEEYGGITLVPDNPNTSYNDSVVVEKLELSREAVNKKLTGTGFNPEGPGGVEGQNPAVYSDMSNVIGESTESGEKINYALNKKHVFEETKPKIDRLTISVNIDGSWRTENDVNGDPKISKEFINKIDDQTGVRTVADAGGIIRVYTPISEKEMNEVKKVVQDAVGFSKQRGDSVTVTNIATDHSKEFKAEDKQYKAEREKKQMIMYILIGIAIVLVAFILFRVISREIERRRRLAEEERIRQQEAERQQALLDAQQQGMEVTMSVEERKRAELQESAIAMAKEHPEDVAMLIRTWLMEE